MTSSITNQNTHGYLFDGNNYTDRERLVMVNEYMSPRYDSVLEMAKEKYGLGANGHVRALDVGCGEGLYLFDIARSERYPQFEAWGFDKDAEAIEVACTFAEIEQRKDLHFVAHDAMRPFAEIDGLFGADGTTRFDLAMARLVLMHLRDYKGVLKEIDAALYPGGTILLMDSTTINRATTYPHPSFGVLWDAIDALVQMGAGKNNIPAQHESLLRELGYTDIYSVLTGQDLGGPTEEGKLMLEGIIIAFENARTPIVERFKLIPADEYDVHVKRLRTEATPDMIGRAPFRITCAHKPL